MNDPLPTAKTNYQTLTPRSNFRQRIMKNQRLFRENGKKKSEENMHLSEDAIKREPGKTSSKFVIKIKVNDIVPTIKARQKLTIDGYQLQRKSRKRLNFGWNKSINYTPTHRKRHLLS